MWGYTCGTAVTGSTATCAALNQNAGTGWSPVVITVPTGATGGLTINLTNNLSFANGNTVPTSIMIVGQVGGGLGTVRTTTPSPDHSVYPRTRLRGLWRAPRRHGAAAARAARAIVRHRSGGGRNHASADLADVSSRARTCLSPARTRPSRNPWVCTEFSWLRLRLRRQLA